jgi:exopolysaccharide biosynthesis polyprenyl glycosylphosphotransferase
LIDYLIELPKKKEKVMNSSKLKQSYQEQLIKFGVHPLKAEEVVRILTREELQFIVDIWPESRPFLSKAEQECDSENLFSQKKVHDSVYSQIKRLIDLLGAIIGLGLTALLYIPIAIAIRIDSPGPIVFSQTRCGLRGKPFKIYKFRTMFLEADRQQHLIANEAEGYIFKNQNDPRVTRIGKFLRRTSLDEFPQFWNVLKGDMSLVGTRPPTPNEVENYTSYHYKRLLVRPGITGLWQVCGRSSVKNFDAIVKMDLDYQHKWSIRYDLKIILETLRVVLLGRGAY